MSSEKENKKLEEQNLELRREQHDLSNSINQLKEERDLLENKNKYLKDQIGIRETNFNIAKNNEKRATQDMLDAIDNKVKRESELNEVSIKVEDANLRLSELNQSLYDLQEVYDKNKKSADKQISVLAQKYESIKYDLDKDFVKYSEGKEKEKSFLQSEVDKLQRDKNTLISLNNQLSDENSATQTVIAELIRKKVRLESDIQEGNETSIDLIDKNEKIEEMIKVISDELAKSNTELIAVKDELKIKQKELDRVLKKIGFIQTKEDSLKSFEAYIIETSNKYGLSYQPYEG